MLTNAEQTKLANLQAKDSNTLTDKEKSDLNKLLAKMEQPQSEKIEKSSDEIVAMTLEERKAYFAAKGYKEDRLNTTIFGQSSNLPEFGTITAIKEVVYQIEKSDKSIEKTNGLRLVVTDKDGKTFECSLARAAVRSIEKTAEKSSLDMAELNFDKNNDVRIVGENLSDIPNHPVLIYDYVGRKVKAEKIQVFTLSFAKRFKTKHEAIENLTIQSAFKVTLVD